MGMSGLADIIQAEMLDLMKALEYMQAHIDDLLCITRGTLEDHLDILERYSTDRVMWDLKSMLLSHSSVPIKLNI